MSCLSGKGLKNVTYLQGFKALNKSTYICLDVSAQQRTINTSDDINVFLIFVPSQASYCLISFFLKRILNEKFAGLTQQDLNSVHWSGWRAREPLDHYQQSHLVARNRTLNLSNTSVPRKIHHHCYHHCRKNDPINKISALIYAMLILRDSDRQCKKHFISSECSKLAKHSLLLKITL